MRQLPKECYEDMDGAEQVINEGQVMYRIEKIDINDGGIFQYMTGAQYPIKGFPEAGGIFAVNVAKRLLVQMLKIGSGYEFYPTLFLFLIKSKKKKLEFLQKLVNGYTEISMKIISPYILIPNLYTPMARESGILTTKFLLNIGITEKEATEAGKIMALMLELDNAYRFRFQDLLTESSKSRMIADPYKEILRLLEISKERDHIVVHSKFGFIRPFIKVGFMFSWIKRAFIDAVSEIKFENLKFDEADMYWVAMRTDYNFWGKGPEERSAYLTGMSMPTPIPLHQTEKVKEIINKHAK